MTLATLVEGTTRHPKLDLIQVDSTILVTDYHVVVGFNCDALVVTNEDAETSDDILVFLISWLFEVRLTLINLRLWGVVINVAGGYT